MVGRVALALLAVLASTGRGTAGTSVSFESGHVRPLALSADGSRLFAVDTPDARLEIFDVRPTGLAPTGSVRVGLEPVSVAVRSAGEVWVVNHLSDSVSVVDVAATPPRVVRTLLVGDEPRDIVFAGPGRDRAFVTTAHRGQNTRVDPQLTTPGVGRADVWVFDAAAPGASLGGDPVAILTLFCDTPRALAVSADGHTVYAAAFQSGNETTVVADGNVCDGGQDASCVVDGAAMPGGLPAPNTNADGVPQPETGLIVRHDAATGGWLDPIGRDWRAAVRLALPDTDVFAIDAMATPPVVTRAFAHVGTVIYGLAVNPVSGAVYASNTEAHNEVRFAGAGIFGGSSVRGRLHETRITVLDDAGVRPRHLNPHIDYAVVPSPPGTRERSLATPTGLAVSADGGTLYVAALGSGKVGVLDTAALEAGGPFVPDPTRYLAVPGGPSGLVLDDVRQRLYVLTRFDHGVAVIDTATGAELQHLALFDAEPASVVAGRPLLYDAALGSSNGEASCASCHVFGDVDALAWDLGDPDGPVVPDPNPIRDPLRTSPPDYHPMKGPLTTQTLRGMANHGAMHWRGDRTGGYQAGVDPRDERAAFLQFNPAFVDLLGRETPLPAAQMEAFADFVLQIAQPPNPVRPLDDTLTPLQQDGRDNFGGCQGCHVIDPAQGYFGTDGFVAMTGTNPTQFMKIPHLETFHTKVGMFAVPPPFNQGDASFIGDQVRGFGFNHDGTIGFYIGSPDLEAFLLAFPTRLAPIVGQQATLDAGNAASTGPRVDLLEARAAAGDCDLVVHGVRDGEARTWLRTGDGSFASDRAAELPVPGSALRAQATQPGETRTYTCAPPGTGTRIAQDRDEDGVFDGDESDAGSDPADASRTPFACAGATATRARLAVSQRADGSGEVVVRGTVPLLDAVDAVAHGVRVAVADADGMLFGVHTPPGVATGWRVNAARTRWRFTAPPGPATPQVTKADVRVRNGTPATVTFKVAGRPRTALRRAEHVPLRFAAAAGMGACVESTFASAGCVHRTGTTTSVVCR